MSGEDAGHHPERLFLPASCPLGHCRCAAGRKAQFIGPMPPVPPVLRHVLSSSPHREWAQLEGTAGLEHLGMLPNPSQAPRPGVMAGPRHRTQDSTTWAAPTPPADIYGGGGIPIRHRRLPLNPRPSWAQKRCSHKPTPSSPGKREGRGGEVKRIGFATYWCPPQPSARLGAGSPGRWAAPAPGPGAQRGLGSGSEQPGDGSCLPCLSLSTGEEIRPGRWGAKNASATKNKIQ